MRAYRMPISYAKKEKGIRTMVDPKLVAA